MRCCINTRERNSIKRSFLLFISMLSLYSSVKTLFSPIPENYNSNNSFVENNISRFSQVDNFISPEYTVGYLTDSGKEIESDPLILATFYQAQYALSPLVLSKKTDYKYIIGDFHTSDHKTIIDKYGFSIIHDFGGGLYLLENLNIK